MSSGLPVLLPKPGVPSWSRGWESNPLQPSVPGCLIRVATRCFCSPSPEPIGLRWTEPTPASLPPAIWSELVEPYKLVENLELPVRNVRVSRSIPRLLLVLRLLLYGHSRSRV